MICVAALIVFSILALFSAKYRPLAKEAFSCVFLKMRLRPCNSGLDNRVRMAVTMPFVKKTPRVAKFIHKYFSVFSAIFVLLTVASFAYMLWGGYNYALYGNCNGPGSTGFCVFDPNGPGVSETGECSALEHAPEALIKPSTDNLTSMKVFNEDANFTVIFFGCYSCKYTREASDALLQTIEKRTDVRFVLIDFPLPTHANSTLAANAANCVYDDNKEAYISYAKELYTANLTRGVPSYVTDITVCAEQEHARTAAGRKIGMQTGIYGTPTYFIGERAVVGPLNKRSLEKLINTEMRKR
jgi:protein-disulfide isomerase